MELRERKEWNIVLPVIKPVVVIAIAVVVVFIAVAVVFIVFVVFVVVGAVIVFAKRGNVLFTRRQTFDC